jgi:general secretion pathway protein I
MSRWRSRGFTLLEVMIGLALLGLGLTVLVKSAANSIYSTQQAHMMGIATDLARAKMYDLEEKLLKDGFSDTTQEEEDQKFSDEGWPDVHYSYKIEVIELPSWDDLQKLALGHATGAGSGSAGSAGSSSSAGSDSGSVFGNSALGGLLSITGGGGFAGVGGGSGGNGSGDIGAASGASLIQSQYTTFQQILKVSIRKVSLTLKWKVMGSDRDMKVVAFFTDPADMDKVINGLGAADLDDATATKTGSGSGGSNTGGSNTGGVPKTGSGSGK